MMHSRMLQMGLFFLILSALSIQAPPSVTAGKRAWHQNVQDANNSSSGLRLMNDASPSETPVNAGSSLLLPVWHVEIIDQSDDVGSYASLAIDSNDQFHIAYYDATNADLKYAHQDSSAWQIEVVASEGHVGRGLALALDGNDYPHITYATFTYDDEASGDILVAINYAYKNANGWHFEEVEHVSPPPTGYFFDADTVLALAQSGEPQVVFQEDYLGPKGWVGLYYAHRADGEWSSEQIDSGIVAADSAIALDDAAHPHISYFHFRLPLDENLQYAYFDGQTWHNATVDNGPGHASSLALNDFDYPCISYYHSYPGTLRYAQWAGTTWVTETVNSEQVLGRATSLVLNAASRPAIIHSDGSNDRLNYTAWNGYRWNMETVDIGPGMGSYASLAIDSNDRGAVAYYDPANQDLKLAYRELVTPTAWVYLLIVRSAFQ